MAFKDDLKQLVNNIMKDVEKEADRKWLAHFEGHEIELHNKMKEEVLIVDGLTVAKNSRQSIWTHIIPYVSLSGEFVTKNGEKKTVTGKVGGFININCTIKVDGKKILSKREKFQILPWAHKQKIVPYLEQEIAEHGKLIRTELPDDDYVYDENHPRLAPGLADQLSDDVESPFIVKKLLKLLEASVENKSDEARAKLYEEINFDKVISYGESFIKQFSMKNFDESAIQDEAIWLLENAADREVLKFAITLLGCTDCSQYKERLLAIGHHEEFTVYVAFALKNGCKDGNEMIWDLAKELSGWGKLLIIPQIEARTAEIKAWFLSEANKNNVKAGYSSFDCIGKGELASALRADEIPLSLYNNASNLLSDLLTYKAANGYIYDYDEGFTALEQFIRHSKTYCKTVQQFYTVSLIEQFLKENDSWEEFYELNWTTEKRRDELLHSVEEITAEAKWLRMAIDILEEDFQDEAFQVTQFYGLNVNSKIFKILEKTADNESCYLAILQSANDRDLNDLCNFASQRFDFENLTTEQSNCVRTVLQNLYQFKPLGLQLIEKALQSNDHSLQDEALLVLSHWPKSEWEKEEITFSLKELARSSQSKEIRKMAKQLLK